MATMAGRREPAGAQRRFAAPAAQVPVMLRRSRGRVMIHSRRSDAHMLSLIIPVYGNERDVHLLVDAIEGVARDCPMPFEAVFVVDGSPDQSFQQLRDRLPQAAFASTLVSLSRNFGAFNAVRCGMEIAAGEYMVVMAADLQDPFDLPMRFLETLTRGDVDIAFGVL